MNTEHGYLIGELAELAGVTPRTIRYYTAEGLLPPPATRGKYARYDDTHLRRLRLIGQLKADYLPLSAIRERLDRLGTAGEGRLAEVQPAAGLARPDALEEGGAALAPDTRQGPSPQGRAVAGPTLMLAEAQEPFRLTPAPLQAGRVEFFPSEPELIGAGEDEGSGGTGRWQRISLGPGVELHVREPLSERRRRLIDELVAGLRDRLRQADAE